MFILTRRAALVRNLAVASVNGAITLVILLIAPLGLVSVWTNTILVSVATFATATAADRIVKYLNADPQRAQLIDGTTYSSPTQQASRGDIEKY